MSSDDERVWSDPVSWYYILTIKMEMPGMFARDIAWHLPVAVGAFSINALKEMDPVKYGGTLEPVVGAGIAKNDLPPPFDVHYPPPTYEATELVNSAVAVHDPKLKIAEDDFEYRHNFSDDSLDYWPAYPNPAVKCSPPSNLPDCRQ